MGDAWSCSVRVSAAYKKLAPGKKVPLGHANATKGPRQLAEEVSGGLDLAWLPEELREGRMIILDFIKLSLKLRRLKNEMRK